MIEKGFWRKNILDWLRLLIKRIKNNFRYLLLSIIGIFVSLFGLIYLIFELIIGLISRPFLLDLFKYKYKYPKVIGEIINKIDEENNGKRF